MTTASPSPSSTVARSELVAVRVPAHGQSQLRRPEGRQRPGQPEQGVDRRPDEQLEDGERRHRVPGEVEDKVAAPDAEGGGLAGLHRDAPEDLLHPEPALHLPDEVVRPDRRAAGRHEHVEAEQSALHRAPVLLLGVEHDPELGGDRAGQLERRGEQQAVGLVDLARPQLLSGLAELRAGDEDADARALRAPHLGQACRRQRPDLPRGEDDAGLEHGLPGPDVAAAIPDVRARGDRSAHLQAAVFLVDELDRDDGVGALGHHAAGGDGHGLARRERPHGRVAGRNPAGHRERDRCDRRVGRTQRVAVHGRARERRQVDGGDGGLGENAPGRALDRHALGLERLRPVEHEPLGLGERDQVSHDAVP